MLHLKVSRFGKIGQYFARKEVILSAGTIGSPQILMLSGVGDRKHLEEVGIKTIHHSPQVGQNLQDHLIAFVSFDTPGPLSIDVLGGLYPSTWSQYFNEGQGPMTSAACSGLAHIHSDVNDDPSRPDVQLHLSSITGSSDYGLQLKHNFGKFWEIY